MGTSATSRAVTLAALATSATLSPEPTLLRLGGWKPRSMKSRKERAAHKRRQKIAKASRRRNR